MASPSHSPRKRPTQERARHTVEAILEAAADVFEEHGFEGGTTERIVARAGVSVGSLYQYFPSKAALLVALADRYCDGVLATQEAWLERLAADDPSLDDGIRAFIDWLVAAHAVRPRLRCLMFEEQHVPHELTHRVEHTQGATVDGLAAWLTGKVRSPRLTAAMLARSVPSLVHHFVLHPQPDIPVELAAAEVFTLARAYLDAGAVAR